MAIINAQSISRTHVAAAVALANYGDTVVVPVGTANWTQEILVEKYMTIQGAGIGISRVTNLGMNDSSKALFRYTPDSTSRAANGGYGGLIRFTGFSFENKGYYWNTSSKGIHFRGNGSFAKYYRNTRVDHCRFMYFCVYRPPYNPTYSPTYYGNPIGYWLGAWAGLVDNCRFTGWPNEYYYNLGLADGDFIMSCNQIHTDGQDTKSWVLHSKQLGSVDAVYIEDCYYEDNADWLDGGSAGNYAWRFNEVIRPSKKTAIIQPDAHGNRSTPTEVHYPTDITKSGGSRSQIQCESYCNKISNTRRDGVSTRTIYVNAGGRGGYSANWGNRVTGSNYAKAGYFYDEEVTRDDMRGYFPSHVTHNGVKYRCIQSHTSSASRTPGTPGGAAYWSTSLYAGASHFTVWASDGAQYKAATDVCYDPIKAYIWDNRYTPSNTLFYGVYPNPSTVDMTPPWGLGLYVKENREYFRQTNVAFNGTSGVGMGTKAQMLAIVNPTEGVAFWVTNEGSWNNSGGLNVLSYNGQGRLYRANASHQWVQYYEPLDYPHPLRSGEVITDVPTTAAPTTAAPTTIAPTVLPTTLAPTTEAPSTAVPTTTLTTLAPTTALPTTLGPTTIAPTTIPPTTVAPLDLALAHNNAAPYNYFSTGDGSDPITVTVTLDGSGGTITSAPATVYMISQNNYAKVRLDPVNEDVGVTWQLSSDGINWFNFVQFLNVVPGSTILFARATVVNDGSVLTDRVSANVQVDAWT